MDKKTIIILVGVAVAVVLAGSVGYRIFVAQNEARLTPEQKIERELQKLIEENIEEWDSYAKTDGEEYKKFGNDATCPASIKGSEDFLSYIKQASEGDIFKLDLTNGAYVLYTPNYNNWDNKALASLTVQDMRICSGGFLTPLYAYPDKVVWGNITCAGLEEETDYCQYITRIIMGYFTKKSQ